MGLEDFSSFFVLTISMQRNNCFRIRKKKKKKESLLEIPHEYDVLKPQLLSCSNVKQVSLTENLKLFNLFF